MKQAGSLKKLNGKYIGYNFRQRVNVSKLCFHCYIKLSFDSHKTQFWFTAAALSANVEEQLFHGWLTNSTNVMVVCGMTESMEAEWPNLHIFWKQYQVVLQILMNGCASYFCVLPFHSAIQRSLTWEMHGLKHYTQLACVSCNNSFFRYYNKIMKLVQLLISTCSVWSWLDSHELETTSMWKAVRMRNFCDVFLFSYSRVQRS